VLERVAVLALVVVELGRVDEVVVLAREQVVLVEAAGKALVRRAS
jgi:hypothetical protein